MSEFLIPPDPRLKGTFRIYRLRAGELVYLGDAPNAKAMGMMLTVLYDEGEFGVDDCVGVKRERGQDDEGNELPGEWIVNPFNLGRSRRISQPDEAGGQRCSAWSKTQGRRCRKLATHGEFCDTHYRRARRSVRPS